MNREPVHPGVLNNWLTLSMKNENPLLPLFPLEVVLFPGATLPLHIFEPRYKEMIGRCLDQQSEFGVVLVQDEVIAEVGCAARITEVVKRYEDGRLDILTEGSRRFEILYQNREEEVLRGEVAFFEDEGEEDSAELRTLGRSVLDVYAKIVLTVSKPNAGVKLVKPAPPRLAYAVAQDLGLPLEFNQRLLGLRSERERLRELLKFLEEIFPKIERLQRSQHKAGGNGHLTS